MSQFSQQFRYLRSRFGVPAPLALPAPGSPVAPSENAAADAAPAAPAAAVERRKSVLAHPSMGALLIAMGAVVGAKFIASTERADPVREPPTIAAPTQAYKAQVAQTGATPPLQQAANRPRSEAPVGPVGATALAVGSPQAASNIYFPEPKTVKSVATDARGRIVDPTPTGTVSAPPKPAVIAVAKPEIAKPETAKPESAKPEVARVEPKAEPAKTVARAEPIRPGVSSNLTPSADAAVKVALPPEAPVNFSVVERSPAQPQQTAAAQDQRAPANVVDSARFARNGGVSIQLAAAGSEDEARALAEKLQHRFAYELDGRPLEIIPAKPRDRIVYRLRLTEISRDEADAICAAVRASRAGCFIPRD